VSKKMSADKLALLLRQHFLTAPPEPPRAGTGSWRDELIGEGLLEHSPESPAKGNYDLRLTERGTAYVERLLATPMPRRRSDSRVAK
jgi:hypothetical protein